PVHAPGGGDLDGGPVPVGDGGDGQRRVRQVQPLVRGEGAGDEDLRGEPAAGGFPGFELEPAVVEQDALPGADVGEDFRLGEDDVVRLDGGGAEGEAEGAAGGEVAGGVEPDAELRPRQVG